MQALPVVALLSGCTKTWGPLTIRLAMAAMYLVIPDAGEVHIVLTNAKWHLEVLQVEMVCAQPTANWRGRLSDLLLFSIGALSGHFCLMLLPIALMYWWARRQRWTLVIAALLSVCSVIQMYFVLTQPARHSRSAWRLAKELLRIIAVDIFFDSVIGAAVPSFPSLY